MRHENYGTSDANELAVLNRKHDTLLGEVMEIKQSLQQILTRGFVPNGSLEKPLLTTTEAANFAGRSSYTIRGWIRKGKLSKHRASGSGQRGRLLVDRAELVRLLTTKDEVASKGVINNSAPQPR